MTLQIPQDHRFFEPRGQPAQLLIQQVQELVRLDLPRLAAPLVQFSQSLLPPPIHLQQVQADSHRHVMQPAAQRADAPQRLGFGRQREEHRLQRIFGILPLADHPRWSWLVIAGILAVTGMVAYVGESWLFALVVAAGAEKTGGAGVGVGKTGAACG